MKTFTAILCSVLLLSLLSSTKASNKFSLCWAKPQQITDLLSVNCERELFRVMRYNRSTQRRKRYIGCRQWNNNDYGRLYKECCQTSCTLEHFLGYCCLA